jgi:hypothetical protein
LDHAGIRPGKADAGQKISQDGQDPEQLIRCLHTLAAESCKHREQNGWLKRLFETDVRNQ